MIDPSRDPEHRNHGTERDHMNDVDHTWRPARFLVIAAHPDDADFGPAGTAARWIDAGSEGWLICCTSGDAGGEDPDADPLELAALREREQRAAADLIGYAGITFLHQPDGSLVNDLVLREQLVREIRTRKPDAALAKSGLAAHRVRRLYLFWPNEPNVRVDITTSVDRKIAALAAHASQIREPEKLAERIRSWAAEEGEAIGSPAAEALRLIVIDEDEDDGPDPGLREATG